MVEELFKKYYPEYVTEKGECLSPYWDLFSTGIECATDELNKGCIQTLTKENAELKDQLALKDEELNCVVTDFNTFKSEAKDLIRNLLRVTYGEGWNYSLDWKVKAEQFLKECEK